MYEKSKAIRPPWPLCYKLPFVLPPWPYHFKLISAGFWSWSPCGTCVAFSNGYSDRLLIVDQQCEPFCNNENDNNNLGWVAHDAEHIADLKFSPDGRFLVSIGDAHDFINYGIMLLGITNKYKNSILEKNLVRWSTI